MNPDTNPGSPEIAPRAGTAAAAVLVGIDGSDTSWDALSWACGEAARLGDRAVAVFVSPSVSSYPTVTGYGVGGVVVVDTGDSPATAQARALRNQLEWFAIDNHVELSFVHARGDVVTELLRLAAVYRAGQIVVGRSTKARHHVAGSLGRRLLNRRDAPVVVVVP